MASNEKFCLRWNEFESNISVAFREIRQEKEFFDCTLSCGSRQIQAHKLVLSACSPFFRSILRQNPHQHPLLYLKGIQFADLHSVLNFMYHGEVNVAQEELNSFLAVAEDLQVKGLTQGNSSSNKNYKSESSPPVTAALTKPKPLKELEPVETSKCPITAVPKHWGHFSNQNQNQDDEDEVQEVLQTVKTEPEPRNVSYAAVSVQPQTEVTNMIENYGEEDTCNYGGYEVGVQEYGGMGMEMDSMDQNKDVVTTYSAKMEGGKYSCKLCGFVTRDKYNIRLHLEGKHELGSGYQCDKCEKYVKTRKDLSEHKLKCLLSC